MAFFVIDILVSFSKFTACLNPPNQTVWWYKPQVSQREEVGVGSEYDKRSVV